MWTQVRKWWLVKLAQIELPWKRDSLFWLVSLAFHTVLLVLLARMFLSRSETSIFRFLSESNSTAEIVELPSLVEFDESEFEEMSDQVDQLESMEAIPDTLFDDIESQPVELDVPDLTIGDSLIAEFENTSSDSIISVQTKGTAGVSLKGASGAIDRITQEILLSLDERKTMVVWLFDESASLITQRAEIRSRIDKIYRELERMAGNGSPEFTKHGDQPLLSMVYGFGGNLHKMLPDPTERTDEILKAIDQIQRDESGLEYVFSSVIQAATDFKKMRKLNHLTRERERNVMIIVVSDEAGDDTVRLDEAVKVCSGLQVPVYVVGIPAPFGRLETQVRWVDPDPNYNQDPQWAIVSQGPESLMMEMVKLDFEENDFLDMQSIDSGFGPFGLTRLAYETGGIYFAVHPNRDVGAAVRRDQTENYTAFLQYFFDPDIMSRYKPDYVTQQTYLQRLGANKARMSLVQAAQMSQVGAFNPPMRRFPKLDEAQFTNQVSLAQRSAAILEPKMNQLYEVLRVGEKDRDMEFSPRWKAGFDLNYGRVLASKVRVESYNAMLAMIKTKLAFEDPEKNTWVLQPADVINTGSQAESMAEQAKFYLKRVVTEHPGTPWAMLAQRELNRPIGWRWQEDFTEPPRPPEQRPNNNNNNGIARVPQPMQNAMPKPTRPPPKL
ncbi:MAG: vWA domain-containing protein [Pirellulaceae bacterium]